MIKNIIIGFIAILIVSSCNYKNRLIQIDEYGNYCIPNHEFIIGKVKFNDTIPNVEKLLGDPFKKHISEELNMKVWFYDDLVVEFHNNLVWSVFAITDKISTPSGIKLGQSLSKVEKKLGCSIDSTKMIISNDSREIQIANCKYGNYMILEFDNQDKLIVLSYDNDIP